MVTNRLERAQPTHEWELLVPLFEWPEQERYEQIRPLVLFAIPVAERAAEVGTSTSTLYRRLDRFVESGMESLFEAPKAKRRGLPPSVRRLIVDLKAEYPAFNLNEISNIVHACFGRRPDYRSVARVLEEEPVPLKIVRNYPPYREARDVWEARAAVVELRLSGWSAKATAGYLGVDRATVYRTMKKWERGGLEGLGNRPFGRPAGVRKADFAAVEVIRKLAKNPGLGAFRVHAALRQMGFDLSRATCGRILAQVREVYGYEKPEAGDGAKRAMPFAASERHEAGGEAARRVLLLVGIDLFGQQTRELPGIERLVADEQNPAAGEGEGPRHDHPSQGREVVDLGRELFRIDRHPRTPAFASPNVRLNGDKNALLDQPLQVLYHAPREVLAAHQQAQLHVQVQRVLRQVGAGDEEGLRVGHGALGVQGAVFSGRVLGALLERPEVHLRELPELVSQGPQPRERGLASRRLGRVSPEDLFAYAYAVLGSAAYTVSFSEELSIPGPRLPITKDNALFRRAVELGRWLIGLHTYGERFGSSVPRGTARIEKAIPDTPEGYPEEYSYDEENRTLKVGEGEIRPVSPKVYGYNVSGLEVVKSWLGYRRKNPRGRSSSPLDDIRPETWTGDMTRELLQLLWVLEATVEKEPELAALLEEIIASEVFTADQLPNPTDEERKPPRPQTEASQDMLY